MTYFLWIMLEAVAVVYVLIGLAMAANVFENCRIDGKSVIVSIAIAGLAMIGWPVVLVYVSKNGFR